VQNQHFVPKHYFRNFTLGREHVSLLLTKSGQIVHSASIRGQCSRNHFYGPEQVEHAFAQLDNKFAKVLHHWIDFTWIADVPFVRDFEVQLRQFALMQQVRTSFFANKLKEGDEQRFTEYIKYHLQSKGDAESLEILDLLNSGTVNIRRSGSRDLTAMAIEAALEEWPLIVDLRLLLLRNRTDFPFVFSDAPVLFYNSYLRNVTNRGTLGLQSPGLQIMCPLDSGTYALLFDNSIYEGTFGNVYQVDVYERADVSQLNALQLHNSENAVYFADTRDEEYVSKLWNAHRPAQYPGTIETRDRSDWLIDGEPITEGAIFHTFETQVGHDLSLSFLTCDRLPAAEYQHSYRNPEIMAFHRSQRDA
jgi:hypothetical protein